MYRVYYIEEGGLHNFLGESDSGKVVQQLLDEKATGSGDRDPNRYYVLEVTAVHPIIAKTADVVFVV